MGRGNDELKGLPDLALHTVVKAWLCEDGDYIMLQHVLSLPPCPQFSDLSLVHSPSQLLVLSTHTL